MKTFLKPVVLILFDGWGISPFWTNSAIKDSNPSNFYYYWSNYPHLALESPDEEKYDSLYCLTTLFSGIYPEKNNFQDIAKFNIQTIPEIIKNKKLKQLIITESIAFQRLNAALFDFGEKKLQQNEYKLFITPKNLEKQPELNAKKIVDYFIDITQKQTFDFILLYFPNLDLIKESNNIKLVSKSIKYLDQLLNIIFEHIIKIDANGFLTSSFGGVEQILQTPIERKSAKYSNFVPFINVNSENKKFEQTNIMNEIITLMINPIAKISSVAPTIVKSLGISVPEQMKGKILDKELL